MNVFRLLGDLSHMIALFLLIYKIWKSRSCSGLSGKSQYLFAIVFITRYVDMFYYFISFYNFLVKVLFVTVSLATVYLMFYKFKATYNRHHDTFNTWLLLIPSFILSLVVNYEFSFKEIMWTFSVYLESVAIMPQLYMISKRGEAETITSHYIFALGSYRAFYLLNWFYRFTYESYFDFIAIVSGVVQTLLYCDFFYLYVVKVIKGRAFVLPA